MIFFVLFPAIRDMNDVYYLNGEWEIDTPMKFELGGTTFDYQRDLPETGNPAERLIADGPTNVELYIVVM